MLSDVLVYAAMKELTQKERPTDQGVWDGNGEIYFYDLSSAQVWKR